ncbi:hypothetical protein DU976_17305 [Vibrio navarrensis]|nr:hypothetical protein [Vibrio navarrensis]
MNKKALLLTEIKNEMKGAVSEIGGHVSNPIFGKFLKPIQNFFNSFGRKVLVLMEVQSGEIDELKKRLNELEEAKQGGVANG